MKNKFKSFLLRCVCLVMVFFLLLCLAMPALADDAGVTWFSCTNTFGANYTTTANLGSGIKIDKQHAVALVLKYQNSTTGTSNQIVKLVRSYDGTTFETTPIASLSFTNAAALGTAAGSTNVFITEIPNTVIGSAHSLKIYSAQNTDTGSGLSTNVYCGILKKLERN